MKVDECIFNNKKDRADLTQTIIIIAGLGMVAVLAIMLIAMTAKDKGEQISHCIVDSTRFNSNDKVSLDCQSDPVVGNFYNSSGNPASNLDYYGNFNSDDVMIKEDLLRYALLAKDFYNDNNRYMDNNEAAELMFETNVHSYPEEYKWNFEYCRSLNEKDYTVIVYNGNDEVMYVSNKNNKVGKFDVPRDELIPVVRNGVPTGGFVSPCYSNTPYSVADRVGTSQIGVLDENKMVVQGMGRSLKGSNGWYSN